MTAHTSGTLAEFLRFLCSQLNGFEVDVVADEFARVFLPSLLPRPVQQWLEEHQLLLAPGKLRGEIAEEFIAALTQAPLSAYDIARCVRIIHWVLIRHRTHDDAARPAQPVILRYQPGLIQLVNSRQHVIAYAARGQNGWSVLAQNGVNFAEQLGDVEVGRILDGWAAQLNQVASIFFPLPAVCRAA